MKVLAVLFAACAISLGLAQEESLSPKQRAMYAILDEVPVSARARSNPYQGSAREAAAGGKLYEQHCVECHGAKAAGTRYGPSLLRKEVRQTPPGSLFWILTNGVVRRGMPVWSKLPEPQRWQIVTFLQQINEGRQMQPTPPGQD